MILGGRLLHIILINWLYQGEGYVKRCQDSPGPWFGDTIPAAEIVKRIRYIAKSQFQKLCEQSINYYRECHDKLVTASNTE